MDKESNPIYPDKGNVLVVLDKDFYVSDVNSERQRNLCGHKKRPIKKFITSLRILSK